MPVRLNLGIYRFYAPVYDRIFGGVLATARRKAVNYLDLRPGDRLLIPGIGTGLDLPLLPQGILTTGVDLSPQMLAQAQAKAMGGNVGLVCMDTLALGFGGETFDAVLFNLILSVVPDGKAAFQECCRVLKPGGRATIFDKFLPPGQALSTGRRVLGWLVRLLGTDPNRRLADVLDGTPGLQLESDEPSLLRGQYRIVRLRKAVIRS